MDNKLFDSESTTNSSQERKKISIETHSREIEDRQREELKSSQSGEENDYRLLRADCGKWDPKSVKMKITVIPE